MTRPAFSVAGKNVVVIGAARSGIAAAVLLARRGAVVTLTDVRPEIDAEPELRAAGVTLELGGHRRDTLLAADLIVLSPGVPPAQPAIAEARAAGVAVMGELELASRWLRGRIIAITGTKGKSTTTTLAGRMLEAGGHRVLVGGNIGHALSAQVEQSTEDTIHVIEASSFQLESADTFHPWIAVLLNFSPDHLDRHADIAEYAAAKARVFANQTASDWAVLNSDDEGSRALAQDARSQPLLFAVERALAEGVVVAKDAIVRRRRGGADQVLVPLSAVRLLGRHLLADVLAAAAVASIAGVDPQAMTRAVEGFTGLEHALEPVREIAGVTFVNDSKATNIESALRAIQSFGKGLFVILGGRFKGGDFADLRDALIERQAVVLAMGEAKPLIHAALASALRIHSVEDLSDAVRTAFVLAAPGETVLLAPGCSSFDMFKDYAERGRTFKQEVGRLAGEWSRTAKQ
ncbi:MAG TPA: UDP-N-acetylmuramoyl-L-alanine--D-glutamate ligase [Vicinamibacterales bacterium]|jgi:UDP-N-acetylmuramoylalanine--D-glutamate ligase